jgi:hypothetical protein
MKINIKDMLYDGVEWILLRMGNGQILVSMILNYLVSQKAGLTKTSSRRAVTHRASY